MGGGGEHGKVVTSVVITSCHVRLSVQATNMKQAIARTLGINNLSVAPENPMLQLICCMKVYGDAISIQPKNLPSPAIFVLQKH